MSNLLWVYVFFAIFFGVLSSLISRKVMINGDAYSFSLVTQVLSAIIFLPLAILNWKVASQPVEWFYLIIAGIIWALTTVVVHTAYKHAELSLRQPLNQTKLLWITFFGVIFLKESLSMTKIIGILIIFFGSLLILYRSEKKLKSFYEVDVAWVLLAAFLISVATIGDKFMLGFFSPETYGFLSYFLPLIILLPFLVKKKNDFKNFIKRDWKLPVISVILSVAGYYFTLKAFSMAAVTTIYPILQLSIIIVSLFGIFFMGERKNLVKKIVGAVIVLVGSILVGK